ncbi:horma domain-containing protein [Ophiostoma piceae UAMH 11346]|uniref:Horma domain-containing protein n=1 Tax=Ophiostoma piceae (strain UAMH 11346) TaxID=1262450 RepID=S3BT40_OPHP1|nr:horma domain-containing protein [Ophiostoma piceae UAMH 11346]
MPTDATSTADSTSLSIDEAVRLYGVLQHFFEVAVHSVLYYRRLYPERAFAAVSAFGVPVHQCRHPAVCAWVRSAVQEIMRQLCGVARKQKQADASASKREKGKGKQLAKPGPKPKAKPKWQPRRLEETTSLPPDRVNAVAVVVHAPFEQDESSDDEDSKHRAEGASDNEFSPSPSQPVPLPAGAVLERWVFDVRHLPHGWPGGVQALRRAQKDLAKRERLQKNRNRDRNRNRQPTVGVPGGVLDEADLSGSDDDYYNDFEDPNEQDDYVPGTGKLNWRDMEAQMRGVVLRLAQAGQQVAALPDGCTFTMAVELSDPLDPEKEADPRRMDARRWIPETGLASKKRKFGGHRTVGTREDREGTGRGATTTVRSVDSAPLFLECWVEESSVKRAVTQGKSAQLALRPEDVLPEDIDDDDDDEDGQEQGQEQEQASVDGEDDAISSSSDDIQLEAASDDDADREALPPGEDHVADTESEMSFGMDVSFGDLVDNSFDDGKPF